MKPCHPSEENIMIKKILTILAITALLSLSAISASAADTAPKSIIHVVTVEWKAGTTPEQIQVALDGVQALPSKYPGITRVWTKSIKVQGENKANAFVMEFADAAAFKGYTDSPAQLEWYKVYTPIRGKSDTFDITNG
jgi:antibiotic biosynthesis monooxygenase (ABM) superfamily enzyme